MAGARPTSRRPATARSSSISPSSRRRGLIRVIPPPTVKIISVPGYTGTAKFLDVAAIVQVIFDYRVATALESKRRNETRCLNILRGSRD